MLREFPAEEQIEVMTKTDPTISKIKKTGCDISVLNVDCATAKTLGKAAIKNMYAK